MDPGRPTQAQPRHEAHIQRLGIVVVQGPDSGRACEYSGIDALTIGSGRDNNLVLSDPTVSRYHLELTTTPAGVLVVVALRTDAGNLQEFDQLGDVVVAFAVEIFEDLFAGHELLLLVAFRGLRAVSGVSRDVRPG